MAEEEKPARKKWEPREMRLLSEYLERFHPGYEHRIHVHVGSVPFRSEEGKFSDSTARLLGEFRRWADAVVIMPDRIILVEVKIVPQPGVISQIEHYAELLPKTPELIEHRSKPITMQLVFAIDDPVISARARTKGILVTIFCPQWVLDYLKSLEIRKRKPTKES